MQKLSIWFLVLIIAVSTVFADVSGSDFSNAVFVELNKVRSNPSIYLHYLYELRDKFEGNSIRKGNILYRTQEGVKAVDEAIRFLKKARPVPTLQLSAGMSRGALDHVLTQGQTGSTGHTGVDSSTPGERVNRYGQWSMAMGENIAYGNQSPYEVVLDLIIDDGVPGRGHRDNIFNAEYKIAGIAYGPHKKYGSMCVITFAAQFTDK